MTIGQLILSSRAVHKVAVTAKASQKFFRPLTSTTTLPWKNVVGDAFHILFFNVTKSTGSDFRAELA